MRILAIFLAWFPSVLALKILIMNPTYATSHVAFLGGIADKLVDAGHTVHMIVTEVDPTIKKYGSKKAQKVIFIPSTVDNAMNHIESRKNPFKPFSLFDLEVIHNVTLAMQQMCNVTLGGYDKWITLKDADGYDVGIAELTGGYPLAVMRMLGVRATVAASAVPAVSELTSALLNVPSPPSFVPSGFAEAATLAAPNLSYLQRLIGFVTYSIGSFYIEHMTKQEDLYVRELDPCMPSIYSLMKEISLFLVNIHPLLDFPRATSHRIIHTGGLGMSAKDAEPLDNDTLSILESSDNGTVIVSFGTYVRIASLDACILDAFLAAFARFPGYNFIWKFDGTEEQMEKVAMHENVFPVKWIQQKAILNHPRTKAFLSHMGVNSFVEGAYAGVPLIAMPLFIDQPYSAAQALRLGIGSFLSKYDLTEESIYTAIDEALHNPGITAASKRVAAQLASYPDDPAGRMVRYIEFVGKNGRIPTMDIPTIPFFVYYSLDVILPILFVLIAISSLIVFAVYKCIRCIIQKTAGRYHRIDTEDDPREKKNT